MIKQILKRTNFKDFFILFIICCIGFWQIVLFQNIMKWDILDINLPWRYFISECLQNGVLPLWNPYMNCGFPQTADPMTWYPVSWAVGFLFGNDLISIQYEYVFHIFIGGVGFYKLGELLSLKRETRLILSISFMFSGLFISNAQHFGWIVSAAWFPLIIYNYIKFCKTLKIKNGVIFVLLLFFQLTGGYAGFFIITAYILVALFLYFWIAYIKEGKYLKFATLNFLLALTFILLSSVVLISSIEISTFLTRYKQLNMDYVHLGALPFKALISFLLPFATTTNAKFWGTDLSLLNCYFGIIPFVFLIYSLTIKKIKLKSLFFIGVIFLCIALADLFPFRKWIYYLPFMNIFRFPTIFRFFAYFIFIILSGVGLNHFLKDNKNESVLRNLTIALIGVLGVFFIYNLFLIDKWKFKKLLMFDFRTFLETASIHDRIFLQAFLAIVILGVFLIIVRKLSGRKRKLWLIVLVSVDMIIATQFNIYHTVIDFADPKPTQQAIHNLPEGFPEPNLNEKIIDIKDRTVPTIPELWRNLTVFHKKTSFTGYTPYYFSTMFKSEKEGVFYSVIKNPLFYLSGKMDSHFIIDSLSIDSLSNEKIRIEDFNPNRVELLVRTNKKQLLTFVQNFYPGWKAYVNHSEVELIRSNYAFMSMWVPEGENSIVFQYKPTHIIIAFYISAFIFITLVLFLMIIWIFKSATYFRLTRSNHKV